ncbi:4Fe-4S binding protein [Acidobacteriota bacterium]
MSRQQKKPSNKPENYKNKKLYGPVATIFCSTNTGSWRILRPAVNYTECSKCGNCQKFCPTDVIEIKEDAVECIEIDWNYCKGCGICANVCVKKCISMVEEESERDR